MILHRINKGVCWVPGCHTNLGSTLGLEHTLSSGVQPGPTTFSHVDRGNWKCAHTQSPLFKEQITVLLFSERAINRS